MLFLAACAARPAAQPTVSSEGIFVEPIAAKPAPLGEATNRNGIIGLAQSIDRRTAQRIATTWVDAVLSGNAQQLRDITAEVIPGSRELLVQRWIQRGRYQHGHTRDEVFDPETVKIIDTEGAVAMVFDVKLEGAPMTRSYMPRPAQSSVRFNLIQSTDGSVRITSSDE